MNDEDYEYEDYCYECGQYYCTCDEVVPVTTGSDRGNKIDTRKSAGSYVINQFKDSMKALKTSKTENTIKRHNDILDKLLKQYKGLDHLDTRSGMKMAETNKNYIEIKQGGMTFRKAGDKLTIVMNETVEYTEVNIMQLTKTLEGGLAIIAAAAKFDNNAKPAAGVSI